jgi:hypothetical protein
LSNIEGMSFAVDRSVDGSYNSLRTAHQRKVKGARFSCDHLSASALAAPQA